MSNEFPENLHIDTENDSDLVRTLRAALRAKGEEVTRERRRAETAEKQSRSSTLADILREKGVSPKVAAFVPADVEPTADAIGAWLEEFGDVFGVQKDDGQNQQVSEQTGGNAGGDDESGEPTGGLSAEGAAAFAAAQQTEAGGQSAAVIGLDKVARVMQEVRGLDPQLAMQKLKEEGLVA